MNTIALGSLIACASVVGVAASYTSETLTIVKEVAPVCSVQPAPQTTLLVLVIDDTGAPMAGVEVTVVPRSGSKQPAAMTTDQTGAVRYQLEEKGSVKVTAASVGFSTSVADRVQVRRGCLSAVTLPMQVAQPKGVISAETK